jgi:hypothetical protein
LARSTISRILKAPEIRDLSAIATLEFERPPSTGVETEYVEFRLVLSATRKLKSRKRLDTRTDRSGS